ncbi:NADPH-dependent FMN reductase [Cryobacterium soli]|uniref:NADPH-dependent FMN reductase n=1 Tax=Cryobacterium soli TaxID=2220095 RepID=UPI000E75040B|nr:NAD(P)H-dependent oxidoreductase [Cryobacterium soli]
MRVMVVIASTRVGRVGGPVGDWVAQAARQAGDVEVDVVDLAAFVLPMLAEPNHPRLKQYTSELTWEWSRRVEAVDAVIFVLPEYNHSYSAPLKNAIDHLHGEWAGKPVGLVSYGGLSGGTRAVIALQPVLVNLGMRILSANVEIAWVAEHVVEGVFLPSERHERALASQLAELAALVPAVDVA